METTLLLIATFATLVFIFSQATIIFFLHKENKELKQQIENENPPF